MNFIHKKTNVHFTVSGKGSAVVLLHGFLENGTMWGEIASVLSEKHKIICIDLLGHGKTENHGYIHTMEDQAEMVKAVLKPFTFTKIHTDWAQHGWLYSTCFL